MSTPTYKLSLGGKILEERLINLVAIDRSGFAGDVLITTSTCRKSRYSNTWTSHRMRTRIQMKPALGPLANLSSKMSNSRDPHINISLLAFSQAQGESAPAALQITKRERALKEFDIAGTTFADVVGQVCTESGYTAKIDNRLASIEMPYTRQTNESDTEFLYRITKERNGLVKMEGNEIKFLTRDTGAIGSLNIEYSSNVMEYLFDFTEKYNIQSILAKYQDIELNGEIRKIIVGSGKGVKILPKIFPDYTTAELAAVALLKHYQRNFISAKIKIPTEPGLLAEKIINLSGFPGGKKTNQQYIIIQVKHSYSKPTGLTSELSLKRPQK